MQKLWRITGTPFTTTDDHAYGGPKSGVSFLLTWEQTTNSCMTKKKPQQAVIENKKHITNKLNMNRGTT